MRIALAGLLIIAACAPAAAPANAPSSVRAASAVAARDTGRSLPDGLHWLRNSAEYRGIALQTYRAATTRMTELSRGLQPGTWAVILDVDETALDNSVFRIRRVMAGLNPSKFSDAEWTAWVHERAATAVPGAVQFTEAVHQSGGRVVFVTNRTDLVCADTKANLLKVGIAADDVLCLTNGVHDKNPRFDAVQQGTAAPGAGPTRVLIWVGDNIQDFPGLSQSSRAQQNGLDLFGDRYFLLPNPLYGSWVTNPQN